jgi:hypothetical protein
MTDAELRHLEALADAACAFDHRPLFAEIRRLRAALAPLHDQLRRFERAAAEYSSCSLHLSGVEAEALAHAVLS